MEVKCTKTHNAGWTGDSIQHWKEGSEEFRFID